MVPRPTLVLRLLNGQVYRYDYKIQTFVPTTFRVIIVCCKDCASNFLLSDSVSFIQAVFTLYVFLVFLCLSFDSILYLISLMDFLVLISKYVVVLKIPASFAGLLGFASIDIGFLGVTISEITISCSQYLYESFYDILCLQNLFNPDVGAICFRKSKLRGFYST